MTPPTRDSPIAALTRAVVEQSQRSWSVWAVDTLLVGAVGVMILYSIDSGLAAQSTGRAGARAAGIFGLAVLIDHVMTQRLAGRTRAAVTALLDRTTGRIVDAALSTDLQSFEQVGPRNVLRGVTDAAARLVPAAGLLVQGASNAVTVTLAVIYIGTLSPGAAVLCLGLMLALIGLGTANNRAIVARASADRLVQARLDQRIDDLLTGFKQVRQHAGRSHDLAADFDRRATGLLDSRGEHVLHYYLRDSITRQAFFVLLGTVALVLPLLVPDAAGETSRLVVAVTFLLAPLSLSVLAFNRLAAAGATWLELAELGDALEQRATASADGAPPPGPFTGLRLDGATFSHASTTERAGFSVGPLDLVVTPGEIVFVTGANGSGKSTFIKLLCGLYRRTGGQLWLGEAAMPVDPGPGWRSRFSTVLAEFALFERIYGYEDVDPERVRALLAELELEDKVRFADGRFDTVDLSTGQRKRLALVIALIQDRPVYVFDEWAADQDPRFRTAFYRRILPALKARGKAVIAVTHDDDAFDACDRRIHLVHGRLGAP